MKSLKLILLLVMALPLAACVSETDTADNPPPPEQVPTHDDSHGWGANLQNVGKK